MKFQFVLIVHVILLMINNVTSQTLTGYVTINDDKLGDLNINVRNWVNLGQFFPTDFRNSKKDLNQFSLTLGESDPKGKYYLILSVKNPTGLQYQHYGIQYWVNYDRYQPEDFFEWNHFDDSDSEILDVFGQIDENEYKRILKYGIEKILLICWTDAWNPKNINIQLQSIIKIN